MGTEDWVLKCTKLITNTKKLIKNLEQSLQLQKYNVKEKKMKKKNKVTKVIKNIYMKFAF